MNLVHTSMHQIVSDSSQLGLSMVRRRGKQNGAEKESNHPKQADFYMTFLLVNFAAKNAMFNLNENNRFVMAQHPSDMRIGVNGMCGQVVTLHRLVNVIT